jgi:hypothetical protein
VRRRRADRRRMARVGQLAMSLPMHPRADGRCPCCEDAVRQPTHTGLVGSDNWVEVRGTCRHCGKTDAYLGHRPRRQGEPE